MSTCFVLPSLASVFCRSRAVQAFRMLSAEALRSRNDQAEQIIITLKNKINLIKQAAAANVSKAEEERLKEENDALRKEISLIRMQLTYAEIKNGAKMYPVPKKSAEPSVQTSDENKAPAAEKPKASSKEPSPPSASEGGKPKKEGKSKQPKEGETKGKKAAAAAEAGAGGDDRMDVSRLDFRIGKIVEVGKHPDADTLYVEQVDLGEGQNRTIVSGLVPHIPIEQMQGRLAMFMCNLKPAKMRGIMSQGMIMCASKDGKVEILEVPSGVQPGDRVSCDGFPGTPDAQLNPKKKIWETLKPDIRVNAEGVACFRGVPFKVEGKGTFKAPTIRDAQIQ